MLDMNFDDLDQHTGTTSVFGIKGPQPRYTRRHNPLADLSWQQGYRSLQSVTGSEINILLTIPPQVNRHG